MFIATLTVPYLLAPKFCMDEDNVGKSHIIGTLFVASGLITLLQNAVGVRYINRSSRFPLALEKWEKFFQSGNLFFLTFCFFLTEDNDNLTDAAEAIFFSVDCVWAPFTLSVNVQSDNLVAWCKLYYWHRAVYILQYFDVPRCKIMQSSRTTTCDV